ncbi:hypothetical protein M7I_7016 [Glarea lozoyensis 74030]|uniref:Uncharacterized protein n=1 Tax=Glarea lozoyensis (strain ATCC 74030 / MF5533) TaxID=1104152 RepID=H0EW56_GLAL7|nr:hypothetical protein M7I_7016 [Glarea lozoyensis 74030]
MNPRSMSAARKWLVVLIVSASSLCVSIFAYERLCMRRDLGETLFA